MGDLVRQHVAAASAGDVQRLLCRSALRGEGYGKLVRNEAGMDLQAPASPLVRLLLDVDIILPSTETKSGV